MADSSENQTHPGWPSILVSRAQCYLIRLPICTKVVLLLCISLAALDGVPHLNLTGVACLNTELVTGHLQIYRLVLSAFVHNGLLHLVFNMLAFVPIAAALERQLGSLRIAHLICLFLLVGDCIHLACSGLLEHFLPQHATCSVGLSGVIFALIVAETHVNAIQHRSFYGLFTVPAAYFPFLLLVVWQFLFPNISFFGHLGGILAGVLFSKGRLATLTPSSSIFQAAEQWLPFRLCLPFDTCISSGGGGDPSGQDLLPVSYSSPQPGRPVRAASGFSAVGDGAPQSSASFSSWLGLRSLLPQTGDAESGVPSERNPLGQGIQPTSQQLPEKADLRKAAAAAAEARAAQSAQPARSASSKGFIQR